jgi:hypothetical protein
MVLAQNITFFFFKLARRLRHHLGLCPWTVVTYPAHPDLVLLERCPDVVHLDLIVIGDPAMPGASL